jgi:RNA polymerase sigma-70 factor (ECF subfamily)
VIERHGLSWSFALLTPLPDGRIIFFDPMSALQRKSRMLIALSSATTDPTALPSPPRAVVLEGMRTILSDPAEAGLSEQTRWMLAVRDTRDRAAFGRLFDFYAPRLKAMVLRSGAGHARADDIVQDVMLAVWQKAGQFDPARSQVSGWIYRIARNRQIDLSRRPALPMPEDLTLPDETSASQFEVLAMDQEASELRRALERLGGEQRAMIEKAYMGELSHSEISEITGLPLGTIKSRIRLGLERLRHELKGLRQA